MGACRPENLTQATFPRRSGPSQPRIWHSFEKTLRSATTTSFARGLKRTQVGGENWLSVALHATRPATMGSRLPANAAVAQSGCLRSDGPRFAHDIATFGEQSARADSGHTRRLSHLTLYSREWLSGRLRRSQAQEGFEGARGGGRYSRTLARLACQSRRRAGPRAGGRARRGAVQEATGESVELAYVDQGYTGERAAEEAQAYGIRLEVVKHLKSKRGFVLLPRRWVVERDFA